MPGPSGERILAADAAAQLRECFDLARTHLRVGSWQGLDGCEVTVVGSVWELHGTVCSCCPETTEASS